MSQNPLEVDPAVAATYANTVIAAKLAAAQPPRPRPGPRLSIVERVYYQHHADVPAFSERQWSRWLKTTEQPYQRQLVVNTDWQPLDYGWIEKPSLFIVTNEQGLHRSTVPTEEERADDASRVIEVAVCFQAPAEKDRDMHSAPKSPPVIQPFTTISPGESLRLVPVYPLAYLYRSLNATARCSVFVVPS